MRISIAAEMPPRKNIKATSLSCMGILVLILGLTFDVRSPARLKGK
jgi:hypothetical protein